MALFATEWRRFVALQIAGERLGWHLSFLGFGNVQEAQATVAGLFEIFGVPDGGVLLHCIGTTDTGAPASLLLHNSGAGGCNGMADETGGVVMTYKASMSRAWGVLVRPVDGERIARNVKADALERGRRVMCSWRNSNRAALGIMDGKGGLQLERGGPCLPWRDVCDSITPLDNRDQAFDALWLAGKTDWSHYYAAPGCLARKQRQINGQPRKKGVKTAPSPSMGPARIILPEESQTAPHGPENPLSVDAEIQPGDSRAVAACKLAARGMTPEEAREVLEAMGF